ncbi:putative C6 transcription factor [Mariannaea sp. PMI_226]|nr:putative C6 transcription factor [Mariannaea sp. PMI_226]
MPEPERRRRRPAISCALCRRRKIRCNREVPCSNCVRSKSSPCVYEHAPPPPVAVKRSVGTITPDESVPAIRCKTIIGGTSTASDTSTAPSHAPTSMPSEITSASMTSDQALLGDLQSMKRRIQELEMQLARTTETNKKHHLVSQNHDIETVSSALAGTLYLEHHSEKFSTKIASTTRSVMHKTRLFGQSHWINGVTLFMDVFNIIEPYVRDQSCKASMEMAKCKSLARIIKKRRAPSWPSPPTPDLPPRDVADELVERYLVTCESIYRVLHIPSFKKAFDQLYAADAANRDTAFLVQAKLVLAIGAITYDDTFSLHSSAIRWIYEAQTWIWTPEYKSRLTIPILQTRILLLLAREMVGVGEDLVWISAGSLLRTAIYMGLHVDPTRLPSRTTFVAEMRRRLWNTILEISLLSCMASGGPPLLSLEDFNTEIPGNLDDDQLMAEDPVLKPDDQFTQVSVAIALRKTFPVRLSIAKTLNSLKSHSSYEETLRLEGELRAVYREISRPLKSCSADGDSPSQFAMEAIDFIIRRYISCLHIPYMGSSLYEATYAYSRKVVIENALKVWAVVYPSSRVAALQSRDGGTSPKRTDMSRLTSCGSAFYRVIAFQSCLFLIADVRSQLQEEVGLGPANIQPHLFSIVDEMKDWCLSSIYAGETNFKGYLFACLVGAQIDGLVQGVGEERLPEILLKATEDSEALCLEILTKTANNQCDETTEQVNVTDINTPADTADEWDFMMSDAQFDFTDMNSQTWVLNEVNMDGLPFW